MKSISHTRFKQSLICLLLVAANVLGPFSSLSLAERLPLVSPEAVGIDGEQLVPIRELVLQEIERGNLPGAVVAIGRRDALVYCEAIGHRQIEPTPEEMTTDTVFDMASLTKPVATATSVMLLVQQGQIRLRDPIAKYIPEFAANGKESITVEHLLTHQGGFVPDNPLKDYLSGTQQAWENIWALKPVNGIGKKFVYTDVGFLVLGELVHRVTGESVAEFAAKNIYSPLGMTATGFNPSSKLTSRIAPTEKKDGKWLRGQVHDPRASALDGIAGHAGLFSTVQDLALYANMMLTGGGSANYSVLGPATIKEMARIRDVAGQDRGLGWDMRSKYSSNRGELYSSAAFGHGGFTGTAMWIDPQLDLFVIFLSSRLHPDGKGSVNDLAGRIGTIAAAAITGHRHLHPQYSFGMDEKSEQATPVALGVDVLAAEEFLPLAGRKIGLITNHTGLDSAGKRTIDLLHNAKNLSLVALFSPEHGLQGKLDQSEILDARDEATNLPIYSLYGKTRRPSPEHLQDIDTFVFDIQDIGTRFYTYISTMGNAMEVAAEHKLKFVVLDRPNPLGGTLVEGPVLDPGKESFVGYHPIAVRHGMTVGELAKMFRAELGLELDLQVIKVEHWRPETYWDATGLAWVNPSPNMRSLAQAVLYPGVGLLETTNVSVGRGTDTPFEVLGSPWIDGRTLAAELNSRQLPGVRFVPIRFTPNASKFSGKVCGGVNITVTNRSIFESVLTGIHLAHALRKLYPEAWEMARFPRLLCDQKVFDAVANGQPPAEIESDYQSELKDYLSRRNNYLLYPRQ